MKHGEKLWERANLGDGVKSWAEAATTAADITA